jgi:glycerol uptake facilitator-like aquaporin
MMLQVFPGIAAITAFTINKEDAGFGSILQIGFAFAIGISFVSTRRPWCIRDARADHSDKAIITCASTSGGHFNPAITICFAVWQGFPW